MARVSKRERKRLAAKARALQAAEAQKPDTSAVVTPPAVSTAVQSSVQTASSVTRRGSNEVDLQVAGGKGVVTGGVVSSTASVRLNVYLIAGVAFLLAAFWRSLMETYPFKIGEYVSWLAWLPLTFEFFLDAVMVGSVIAILMEMPFTRELLRNEMLHPLTLHLEKLEAQGANLRNASFLAGRFGVDDRKAFREALCLSLGVAEANDHNHVDLRRSVLAALDGPFRTDLDYRRSQRVTPAKGQVPRHLEVTETISFYQYGSIAQLPHSTELASINGIEPAKLHEITSVTLGGVPLRVTKEDPVRKDSPLGGKGVRWLFSWRCEGQQDNTGFFRATIVKRIPEDDHWNFTVNQPTNRLSISFTQDPSLPRPKLYVLGMQAVSQDHLEPKQVGGSGEPTQWEYPHWLFTRQGCVATWQPSAGAGPPPKGSETVL